VRLLIRWVINTLIILLLAYVPPHFVSASSLVAGLVAALVLGLVNTFVRPVFRLLSLPISLLTLGLFVLVLNVVVLEILSWIMQPSFTVSSFVGAIVAAIVISVLTTIVNIVVGAEERAGRERERHN